MDRQRYIHLYVEKFDTVEKFMLLDFATEDEFLSFAESFDYQDSNNQTFTSTLLFEQVTFSGKVYPKEGAVYRVALSSLLGLQWDYNFKHQDYVPMVAFKYTNEPFNQTLDLSQLFLQEVSAYPFTYKINGSWEGTPCGAEQLTQNIELVVKQVGQGSWNEIRSQGKCKIIFDIGCSIFYSYTICKNLLGNDPFRDRPSLIISHWDVDHYNLLTVATDEDLQNICCVFVPASCVSLTSKKVAARLEANCNYLCSIETVPTRKIKRQVSLHVKYKGVQYILFVGETSKDKNLSGLALIVWNNTGCVFLCADHSYRQIFRDMNAVFLDTTQTLNSKKDLLEMQSICHIVVPHHGGNAGKIEKSYSLSSPGQAIVSTGKNNYGHPLEYVRAAICNMGFKWIRVDYSKGDIKITL